MRGFDDIEFKERVEKARLLMKKNNLEMLLLTSPHNFRYFTGLDSYFWEVLLVLGIYYYRLTMIQ